MGTDGGDLEVTELRQHLTTRAAGRRRRIGVRDDDRTTEPPGSAGDGGADRGPLGTDGQAIRRVFHVTAGVDGAVIRFQSGTDVKMGVGRISTPLGGPGGRFQ